MVRIINIVPFICENMLQIAQSTKTTGAPPKARSLRDAFLAEITSQHRANAVLVNAEHAA